MNHDDNRTHGADSAVNDEVVHIAANMTEDADEAQEIPGIKDIPADMPNSPPGDMPLAYTLQNFNALVAANTAMQSEVHALNDQLELVMAQRDQFVEATNDARADCRGLTTQIKDLQAADRETRKRFEDKLAQKEADLQFAIDQRDVLQRKLDRSTGYLDRVLDEEAAVHTPSAIPMPAPRPDVGPALHDIPPAIRRDQTSRRPDMDYAYAAQIDGVSQHDRRRRY